MSENSSGFPAAVWDGLGPNRSSLKEDRRPDYEDYDQLVAEVRAIQTFLSTAVPYSALGSNPGTVVLTNTQGTTMVPGQIVYVHTDGTVKLCDTDGAGILRDGIGIVEVGGATAGPVTVRFAGLIELSLAQWDAVGTDAMGLDPGVTYFASDVAGEILAAPGPATTGDTLLRVGIALTATQMLLRLDYSGLTA